MTELSNDNTESPPNPEGSDTHGQAALLLVESLIHGLVARKVIGVAEAVEIVDVAAEVKADTAAELGDPPSNMRRSLAILNSIRTSLAFDLPDR